MGKTILVLGSGPIRIGQGIEFDYSCVHCVWALRERGYRALILNNNPETVSTDFDTGDGLYFEPVTHDDVVSIVRHESVDAVVTQFGGQTAINLAEGLHRAGIKLLGTSAESISLAEDRDQFENLLRQLDLPKPPGRAVRSYEEASRVAEEIGYPVLVRPSFVLGGRAMEIVSGPQHLAAFYAEAESANPGQPVLVDKYFVGTEAEVDVISDGTDTLVPGIMEHVERAGVHSGDSMAVYPPVTLTGETQTKIVRAACDLAKALRVKGLMNIQFVVVDGEPYILEVNPRASRTVPYISKVTGIPMVALATRCAIGDSLQSMGYESGTWWPEPGTELPNQWKDNPVAPRTPGRIVPLNETMPATPRPLYAVKAPVFSFQKLARVEPALGPEMKSTGEVLGIDRTFEAALYKALIASGVTFRAEGQVILTVADEDKEMVVGVAERLQNAGFEIGATNGTHRTLAAAGINSERLGKVREEGETLLDRIYQGRVSLMVNTPTPGQQSTADALRIRRACIETGVACLTSIDTARALASALDHFKDPEMSSCMSLTEYVGGWA
ncbi:MAG: carbamoyl-phosphate synthase large subunit [Fimbriimonadaceae bacterium]|nr:carbamoyl-phosphate synthase large subunit [Fimbriimonadaceae bacterium]